MSRQGKIFFRRALAEADVMRRVLAQADFAKWLSQFLPQIPKTATASWLSVAIFTRPK
jgi:hypothetical protein